MATFIYIIYRLLEVYQMLILAYVLLSWFPNFRGTMVARFLYRACDPYISKFRRIIPPIAGMDFSPLIGFMLLNYAVSGFRNLIASGAF